MSQKTILLIDDDLNLLTFLSVKLSQIGYKVIKTENSQQAIEAVKREAIHLIISDVYMPGLTGTSLVQALRADKSVEDVPIIVMSSLPTESLKIEAEAMGALEFLPKPVDFERLSSLIFLNISEKHTIPNEEIGDTELLRKKQRIIGEIAKASRTVDQNVVAQTLVNSLLANMNLENVSFWVFDKKTSKMKKLAHSGIIGLELPLDEIFVTSESTIMDLFKSKKGFFVNNAFKSGKAIDPKWAQEVSLIAEVAIPVFDIDERLFLTGKAIDFNAHEVFGTILIHRNQLITEAEFNMLDRLVRQMSSLLSHVYHRSQKLGDTGQKWDNIL